MPVSLVTAVTVPAAQAGRLAAPADIRPLDLLGVKVPGTAR